jgi:D-glycero-D-manno-heptose 1,7-bisphosphate phosphatase
MIEDRLARMVAAEYVFLDRDGVINRKRPEGEWVTRSEELVLLPGAAEAIAALKRSGRKVIVITNQRAVALGLMTEADLEAIHERLRAELARDGGALDAIYYCPHDRAECRCRKPRTGMVEAAFRDFSGARPENSVFIGDSLSDIECGRNAGTGTILIEDRAGLSKPGGDAAKALADGVAASLGEAVRRYLIPT